MGVKASNFQLSTHFAVGFRNFKKILKGRYLSLVRHRNVNFGLLREATVQFLKNVVCLILSKQCESYNNSSVKSS